MVEPGDFVLIDICNRKRMDSGLVLDKIEGDSLFRYYSRIQQKAVVTDESFVRAVQRLH